MAGSPKEEGEEPSQGEVPANTGSRRVDDTAPTLAGEEAPSGDPSNGPRTSQDADLLPGEILGGHYRVERQIGRGGMGSVYVVEHVELGKKFAAKVVSSLKADDEGAVQRLRNEARTLSSLDHENIVGVTHLGRTEQGRIFVVMELLQGKDLARRMREQQASAKRNGGDPWLADEEVRQIVPQVLFALSAAHNAQVVHRDLKPENLYLAQRHGRMVVKVVDFGISKIHREKEDVSLTQPGQILGTPLYMAPEQARSTAYVDHRADLYALGCIIHEMLTGRPPFQADSAYDCVLMHATDDPEPPSKWRPDLPAPVEAFLLRCLEKDPDARFPDADAMLQAWREAWREVGVDSDSFLMTASAASAGRTTGSGDFTAAARSPEPGGKASRFPRRTLIWMAAIAVSLAGGAAALWPGSSGEEDAETVAAESAAPPVAAAPPSELAGPPEVDEPSPEPASAGAENEAPEEVESRGADPAPDPSTSASDEAGEPTSTGTAPAEPSEPETAPAEPSEPEAAPAEPSSEPEAAPEPAEPSEPEAAPEPAEPVTKQIASRPRAAVWVEDERVGNTPVEIEVPAEETVEVKLGRRGYRTVRREVSADDDDEITIRLRRARRRGLDLPLAPR